MTNKQKNAIKEAAYKAWLNGNSEDAVLAGIEKYDELANKEFDSFVKRFIHLITPSNEIKVPELSQSNSPVVCFKPVDSDKNEIRTFDSLPQLINKLSAEYHCSIAIRNDLLRDNIKKAQCDPHLLMKIHIDNDGIIYIDDCIGSFNFTSLKKG